MSATDKLVIVIICGKNKLVTEKYNGDLLGL